MKAKPIPLILSSLVVVSLLLLAAQCVAPPTPEKVVETVVVKETVEVEKEVVVTVEVPVAEEAKGKFEGVTINVALLGGTEYENVYRMIPLWEELTGGKVNVVAKLVHQEVNKKQELDFASGACELDVIATHQGYTPGWLQYLADLKPYIPQEFLDGFFPAYIQASTYDGMLACLPRHADYQVIFYRADLFEDPKEQEAFKQEYGYDLKPPTNWKEADDMAKFFTRPPDLYGTSIAGAGEPLVIEWLLESTMAGGDVFAWYPDGTLEVTFNQEPGVAGLQHLVDWFKTWQVMPPGTNTYGWNENNKAFRDGQVAFYLDYNGFYGANQDPEQSKVAGKFKVAPPYSGPAKPFAMGAFHSYSMTKCAEDKGVADAAASFIMFMTSDEITFVENNEGGTLPVRQAVASMLAEAAEGDPAKQAFWQAAGETGSMASDWGIWHDPNWGQHADIIAPFLEKALIGELTAQEALDQAAEAVIKSLDDIGLLHK